MHRNSKFFSGLLTALLMQAACSSETPKGESENPFEGLPVIETGNPIDISEQGVIDELGEFYFSSNYFERIAVGEDGNVFVSNRGDNIIWQFDNNGEYLEQIGSEGEGPGEFQFWPNFDLAGSVTMFVIQRIPMILSRFIYKDESWTFADDHSLDLIDNYEPDKVLALDGRNIAIIYRPALSKVLRTHASDEESLRDLNYQIILFTVGEEPVKQAKITIPFSEIFVFNIPEGGGMVNVLPFRSNSIVDVGYNGKLYHVFGESFTIKRYNHQGSVVDSISHPDYHRELTENQIITAVKEITENGATPGPQYHDQMVEAMTEATPEMTPSIKDFHVDRDTGAMIVRRHTFEDEPNWLKLNSEGERVGVFKLSENLDVDTFRNGRVYGTLHDEDKLPTVRIVELKSPAGRSN